MFQLSIDNRNIGRPMLYENALIWQNILAGHFPDKVIWLKRVGTSGYTEALVVFPTRESATS